MTKGRNQCKTLYLGTKDDEGMIYEDLPLANALAHLRAEMLSESKKKVSAFTEDEVARIFAKSFCLQE